MMLFAEPSPFRFFAADFSRRLPPRRHATPIARRHCSFAAAFARRHSRFSDTPRRYCRDIFILLLTRVYIMLFSFCFLPLPLPYVLPAGSASLPFRAMFCRAFLFMLFAAPHYASLPLLTLPLASQQRCCRRRQFFRRFAAAPFSCYAARFASTPHIFFCFSPPFAACLPPSSAFCRQPRRRRQIRCLRAPPPMIIRQAKAWPRRCWPIFSMPPAAPCLRLFMPRMAARRSAIRAYRYAAAAAMLPPKQTPPHA